MGLHTGIVGEAWVLHHTLGHHLNYLDQSRDESAWKTPQGRLMSRLEYTLKVGFLAYPTALNKMFMLFNDIEDFVMQDSKNLGVIIHENRFTYQQKGLHKIIDLGDYWEKTQQVPIPLGGIVVNNRIDKITAQKVDN